MDAQYLRARYYSEQSVKLYYCENWVVGAKVTFYTKETEMTNMFMLMFGSLSQCGTEVFLPKLTNMTRVEKCAG